MLSRRRRRGWLLGGGAAGGLLGALLILGDRVQAPAGPWLFLQDQADGRTLGLPLQPGRRFTLDYRHSVTGTPVQEAFSVAADGTITLEELRFTAIGAGIDHWPGHGRLAVRGSTQVIEGLQLPVGAFTLRVGSPDVDTSLLLGPGQRFRFIRFFEPGRAVHVSARPPSRAEYLWRLVFDPTRPLSADGERVAAGSVVP